MIIAITVLLIIGKIISGVYCKKYKIQFIKSIYWVWIIKIIFSVIFIETSWHYLVLLGEEVYYKNNYNLYDPIKYYFQAYDLLINGLNPENISLNYTGILYIYAISFSVFGFNEYSPAIFNNIYCLISIILVIVIINKYILKVDNFSKNWILLGTLLIPDLIWFDSISSRETIIAYSYILSTLILGLVIQKRLNEKIFWFLLILSASFILIAMIRPPILLAVFLSTFILYLLSRKIKFINIILFISCLILFFYLINFVNKLLGGNAPSIFDILASIIDSSKNIALNNPDFNFNDRSLTLLLIPNTLFEVLFFTPIRILAYLVNPFQNLFYILINFDAASGIEELCKAITALINIIICPLLIGGIFYAIRNKNLNLLLFLTPYWTILFVVGGGNMIIHERYRVMSQALIFPAIYILFNTLNFGKIFSLYLYSSITVILYLGLFFIYKAIY